MQAHELVGYLAQVQTHSLAQVLALQRIFIFFFFFDKEKEIGGNVHTQKEQRGGSLTSSLESHKVTKL